MCYSLFLVFLCVLRVLCGKRRSLIAGLPACPGHQELGKQRHGATGRTLLTPGFPGRARDIQVRPFEFSGETREKARGGTAATRASAHAYPVAQMSFELLLIL